jgi:hypothetical protein
VRNVSRSSPVLGPERTVLASCSRSYHYCNMADELFTQMCNTYAELEALFGGDNKYLQRAIEYARSICDYTISEERFVINKSDLTCQLCAKIERLVTEDPNMLDDIICEVMFRFMYVSSDTNLKVLYFRDIQGRKLRWRLED